MRGIRLVALLALALGVTACESTPAERLNAACTVFCGCELPPVPSQQDACIEQCVAQGLGVNISEECTSCITAHADACSEIEPDCEPICDPPDPIDDPVGDPPPMI